MASDSETEPLLRSVNSLSYSSSDYITARNTNSSRVSSIPSNSRWHFVPGVIILILVLLERIAYYSLTGNLYLFLNKNDFCWESNNAISALLIFTGISYLSCLFGGWLSDAYLGRFRTIGPAFVLFTAAYWFLPYLSELCSMSDNCFSPIINSTNDGGLDIPLYEENCSWLIMCVLIAAAIGTGTVKANITPFGAEQVRYSGTNGLRIYLNWLYWCVNIGALIAILGITYIQQDFKSRDLMYKGFKYGYIIPAALLCCATFLFWFTFPFYTHQSASGSSISRIFSVLKDAWKINRANKGVRKRLNESSSLAAINKPSWLDMAKVRFGGKFHESAVEDVKSLSTIIIVFISLIPYWMLYFQMQSTFLAQGLQMRLSFQSANSTSSDDQKFSIPAAWLMLFNVLFLIIFIPLMNQVIYPYLDKRGIKIGLLTRMAFGMVCATLSMFIAGGIEIWRLDFIHNKHTVNQTIENTLYVAADLSIFWQIPQYSLIGISEVFTSVSGMEFACSQAPSTMQSAVMGLYYFCAGIGSFIGVAAWGIFNRIIKPHMHSSNINYVELHYYFFALAVIQLLTLIVFCFISKNLKIRKPPAPNNSTTSSFLSSVSRGRV